VKLVTRHVWADDLEHVEENRYTYEVREWYGLRKETTERSFAQAKELHSFRYTQKVGKARMEMKAALTFACVNLMKLAKRRWRAPADYILTALFSLFPVSSLFPFNPGLQTRRNPGLSTV